MPPKVPCNYRALGTYFQHEALFAAEPESVMEIAVKCLFLNRKTFGSRLGILGDSRKHGGVSAIVKPNSFNPQVLVL
jgi:hypothetical protein